MICDKLKNSNRYSIFTQEIIDFISKISKDTPKARFELSNGIFAQIQRYQTKNSDEAKLENHKNYIDIHYIVSGQELVETSMVSNLEIATIYDAENDIEFYKDGKIEDLTNLKLQSGFFAILYPLEAHKPRIVYKEATEVVKVMIKVPI